MKKLMLVLLCLFGQQTWASGPLDPVYEGKIAHLVDDLVAQGVVLDTPVLMANMYYQSIDLSFSIWQDANTHAYKAWVTKNEGDSTTGYPSYTLKSEAVPTILKDMDALHFPPVVNSMMVSDFSCTVWMPKVDSPEKDRSYDCKLGVDLRYFNP